MQEEGEKKGEGYGRQGKEEGRKGVQGKKGKEVARKGEEGRKKGEVEGTKAQHCTLSLVTSNTSLPKIMKKRKRAPGLNSYYIEKWIGREYFILSFSLPLSSGTDTDGI